MSATVPIRITVEDFDPVIDCIPGESFLQAAARAGLMLATACSGEGRCRSCAVRVISGMAPEIGDGEAMIFSNEQLDMGWRRACRMVPVADCSVHVPRRSLIAQARQLISGSDFEPLPADPVIRSITVKVPLNDHQYGGDFEQLQQALNHESIRPVKQIDIDVLRGLGSALRQHNGSFKVFMRDSEVIGTGSRNSRALGVAIDLGTTKIAAFLINLKNGATLAAITTANPQARFGGDVVTRLTRAIRNEDDRQALRKLVVDGINALITDLCNNAMTGSDQVFDLVIAGNTAMHHLFAGLPVAQLGKAPFVPVTVQAMDIKARELGLDTAPGAYAHLPGIIAGYVGSDHTTALLACAENIPQELTLIVDIGTNTEISLVEADRILSASCPSGPALEGGQISCGMPAADGAISAVNMEGSALDLTTIGGAMPAGLCGSGVIDLVAQLFQCNIVNTRGRLDQGHPRVTSSGGQLEFVLVQDGQDGQISFSQDDIRAVQLAKAAIRAGIDLLLKTLGRHETDICCVMVAGAFGSHINLNSAIIVGLLPDLPLDRFWQIGNAAGRGARLALTSAKHRAEAKKLAQKAAYVELAAHTDFMRVFVGRINFAAPKTAWGKQNTGS